MACLIVLMPSCQNKALDLTPPDQLSTTVFWKSPSDADLALTGIYSNLYTSTDVGWGTSQYMVMAWDNYSDDSYGQYAYTGGGLNALTSGLTPNSGTFQYAYYENCYIAISSINSFLANVSKVLTGNQLNAYKGEAFFLRAQQHLSPSQRKNDLKPAPMQVAHTAKMTQFIARHFSR